MGCFLGLILCVYNFFQNYNCPLQDEFAGTFVAGEGGYQTSFSIDQRTGKFYYANQNQKLFIDGSFETIADSAYYLECYEQADKDIIPNQTIEYEDLVFFVNINGDMVGFKKNSNMVIFVNDVFRN